MTWKWPLATALAIVISSQAGALGGDWKSELAKKAVGKAAREGIEEAVEDAIADAAFDPAFETVSSNPGLRALAPTVGVAIEEAMRIADVASSIDTALDVADAAKKIHKTGKAIKKIKKIAR
jgi:hypothetical protein